MSRDALTERIRIFLEDSGIDAMHTATVLCILILLSYRNDIKNWEGLPGWNKGLVLSCAFATIVLGTISLLRIVGVIQF